MTVKQIFLSSFMWQPVEQSGYRRMPLRDATWRSVGRKNGLEIRQSWAGIFPYPRPNGSTGVLEPPTFHNSKSLASKSAALSINSLYFKDIQKTQLTLGWSQTNDFPWNSKVSLVGENSCVKIIPSSSISLSLAHVWVLLVSISEGGKKTNKTPFLLNRTLEKQN